MKKILLISTILFIFSCKKENSYPVYDLTPEERKWLVYNVGDTLVFYDSLGNGDVLAVTERNDQMLEVEKGLYDHSIAYKFFNSKIKIAPLGFGYFQQYLYLMYTKEKSGLKIIVESNNIFNSSFSINTRLKDTLVRDSTFKNCIFLQNINGQQVDSSFRSIVYSKDGGIVAVTNYKNKLMVKGKWK